MDELDMKPTSEEQATKQLTWRKAPGKNGTTVKPLIYEKPALLNKLHYLLCMWWQEGIVLQEIRDANISTLYKNKSDRSNWNNYCGISLLRITSKLFVSQIKILFPIYL